jgi:hypothetical protein
LSLAAIGQGDSNVIRHFSQAARFLHRIACLLVTGLIPPFAVFVVGKSIACGGVTAA